MERRSFFGLAVAGVLGMFCKKNLERIPDALEFLKNEPDMYTDLDGDSTPSPGFVCTANTFTHSNNFIWCDSEGNRIWRPGSRPERPSSAETQVLSCTPRVALWRC